MTEIRPLLASVLLAVLAVGGVVLPAVHRATHGLETAAERSEHVSTFHEDAGADEVQTPCPPPPHDVDCAVCTVLWAAADLTATQDLLPDEPSEAVTAYADWIRTTTATGAGARAPPLG